MNNLSPVASTAHIITKELDPLPCQHKNIIMDSSGGMRFVEGDVFDDIRFYATCLDCGQILAELDGVWLDEGEAQEPIPDLGDL